MPTTVTDSITIAAPPATVWAALVDPVAGRLWRGADYDTDWQPGSPIRITAEIGAKRYRDRGTVLSSSGWPSDPSQDRSDRAQKSRPPSFLSYEFLPRVSGLPDVPESYSTVTMQLEPVADGTLLTVTHTVPPSPIRRGKTKNADGTQTAWEIGPESGHKHVEFYWRSTLPLLRDLVEGRPNLMLEMARKSRLA